MDIGEELEVIEVRPERLPDDADRVQVPDDTERVQVPDEVEVSEPVPA